ncbi:hypothetical protein Dimus_004455 [Dionaea muscipula]
MASMEAENPASMPSTPVTPGTPLFGGLRAADNRSSTVHKTSVLRRGCKCFTVDTWASDEGGLPAVSCTMTMPPPPVPLAKKVPLQKPLLALNHDHCYCEPKDTRFRDPHRASRLNRPCSSRCHPLDRAYIRCTSQSICDHCLCYTEALSKDSSACVY